MELSIVVPAYNRERSISATIRSIGLRPGDGVELIVVDDGSTDGTGAVARRTIVEGGLSDCARVVFQPNAGPGAARNHGVRLAGGRFVAFLDSDDRWYPWTLEILRQALAAHGDAALLFLRAVYSDDGPEEQTRRPLEALRGPRFLELARTDGLIPGSNNLVVRREAMLAVGGFTETIRACEDTDLLLRMDRAGPCVFVMQPAGLMYHSGPGDRLSRDFLKVRAGVAHMLANEARGAYPGGCGADPDRARALAGAVRVAAELGFATGHPLAAAGMILRHFPSILRRCGLRLTARLVLTPALSQIDPDRFQFRLRPVRHSG